MYEVTRHNWATIYVCVYVCVCVCVCVCCWGIYIYVCVCVCLGYLCVCWVICVYCAQCMCWCTCKNQHTPDVQRVYLLWVCLVFVIVLLQPCWQKMCPVFIDAHEYFVVVLCVCLCGVCGGVNVCVWGGYACICAHVHVLYTYVYLTHIMYTSPTSYTHTYLQTQ